MDEKEIEKYLEQYYRISNTIIKFRNLPLSFDGSYPLQTASIHLIDMIGKKPGANLTELADTLCITRGAVSQMAATHERKGLLTKTRDPNGKDVHFALTNEGRKVYDGHEKFHKDLCKRLSEILDSYSSEELQKFELFVTEIEKAMLFYRKEQEENII